MKAIFAILAFIGYLFRIIVTAVKESFGVREHMSRESHSGYSKFVAEAKSKVSGAQASLLSWLAMLQNSPNRLAL